MLLVMNVPAEELDQLFSLLILVLDEPSKTTRQYKTDEGRADHLAVVPFLKSFIRPPSILSQMYLGR